jgi:hypothetical protein
MWLVVGLVLGGVGVGLWLSPSRTAQAGSGNDRFEDYILCTGPVSMSSKGQTDGVWLLDYKAGKLLGTVIDRTQGKIIGWAEVDLVTEFNLPPRQNVHFMMVSGQISPTQGALYIAETTSGKFGVYSMHSRTDGQPGVIIDRNDMVLFRQPAAPH